MKNYIETEIEKEVKRKFKHLSNIELVKRANSLPDFMWDDEECEIYRWVKKSGGKFEVKMQGNELVILRNE